MVEILQNEPKNSGVCDSADSIVSFNDLPTELRMTQLSTTELRMTQLSTTELRTTEHRTTQRRTTQF